MLHTTAPVASAQLVGYIAGMLPLSDWHRAPHLAADVATATAGTAPLVSETDPESGLPVDVASAARAAARDYVSSPWLRADEMYVRVRRPYGGDDQLAAVMTALRATDGPPADLSAAA